MLKMCGPSATIDEDVIEEDQYKGTHPVTAEIVSLIDDRLYKQKKELKREQAKAREKLDKMLVWKNRC